MSTTVAGGAGDSQANDDDISTTVAGGAGNSQSNDDDISTTVAGGAGDSQANDNVSTTVAGGGVDSQASDYDISTTIAGGAGDSQANDDDISTVVAGGTGDSQANDDDISTMVAGGAGDSLANDDDISTSTTVAGGGVYSHANYLDELIQLRRNYPKNIIIAHLNINSMKNKYIIATEMLHQKLLDILIIGESKIDDTYSDAIFDVNGYRLYRNYRTARGGGIMAYVSCEIPSRRLPRTEPNTIEAIHVEFLISEKNGF